MNEISDQAVWAVCAYRNGFMECNRCPESFKDTTHGECYHGCYLLARETIEKSLKAVAEHPAALPEGV